MIGDRLVKPPKGAVLLPRFRAAALLGISPRELQLLEIDHAGPKYLHSDDGRVRYWAAELKKWQERARDKLVNTGLAARHIGITPQELRRMTTAGLGPQPVWLPERRDPHFWRSELDRWLSAQEEE